MRPIHDSVGADCASHHGRSLLAGSHRRPHRRLAPDSRRGRPRDAIAICAAAAPRLRRSLYWSTTPETAPEAAAVQRGQAVARLRQLLADPDALSVAVRALAVACIWAADCRLPGHAPDATYAFPRMMRAARSRAAPYVLPPAAPSHAATLDTSARYGRERRHSQASPTGQIQSVPKGFLERK
jgi:hypothetical protein